VYYERAGCHCDKLETGSVHFASCGKLDRQRENRHS